MINAIAAGFGKSSDEEPLSIRRNLCLTAFHQHDLPYPLSFSARSINSIDQIARRITKSTHSICNTPIHIKREDPGKERPRRTRDDEEY